MTATPAEDRIVATRPSPLNNTTPFYVYLPTTATDPAWQLPAGRPRYMRAGKRGPFFGRWAKVQRVIVSADHPRLRAHGDGDPDWSPSRRAAYHAAMRLPTDIERARAVAQIFGRNGNMAHPLATNGPERAPLRPSGLPGRPLRPWRWIFGPFQGHARIAPDLRSMQTHGPALVSAELVAEFGMGLVAAYLGIPVRVVRGWLHGEMPPPHLCDRMLLWRAAMEGRKQFPSGVVDCRD